MLLNYLAMAEVLTKLGFQDTVTDIVPWKRAVQFDKGSMTPTDFVLKFGWSEHSYKHKNQWFSWAEKLVWSKCWNPEVPKECKAFIIILCYLTQTDVDCSTLRLIQVMAWHSVFVECWWASGMEGMA